MLWFANIIILKTICGGGIRALDWNSSLYSVLVQESSS